jgi:hypothetical protein
MPGKEGPGPDHTGPRGGDPMVGRPQHLPTSSVLEALIRDAPSEQVTLAWLMDRLRRRSYGIVLLLLGVAAMLPGVSPAAGLLLTIPAFQMARGDPAPVFPRRIAQRPFSTAKLVAFLPRLISALRWLERAIRPRWPTPFEATKRVVGGFVLLLGLGLLAPIPLSNIPMGFTVILLAFAWLEEDGVLLALTMVAALGLFAVALALLWGTVAATVWLTA